MKVAGASSFAATTWSIYHSGLSPETRCSSFGIKSSRMEVKQDYDVLLD
ncbi:hypothetical protein BVRB_1g013320 [Beta vulgaris subsp. vulgaris]|nr:hypothetical protein BVRB_1g013320 [Beta vulgaris subsp. vulgaris]